MPTVEQLKATIAQYQRELEEHYKTHPTAPPVKLDLGCGNHTRRAISGLTADKGWIGVDLPGTQGIDVACDLATEKWPWPDDSVDEVNCAHMLEHVPRLQRIHFFNELYRVLKKGAKAAIITPHWASCRAYGDVTHEWPPVSEMFWGYLNKQWRAENAPHVGFTCDFDHVVGYLPALWLQAECANRNPEYVSKRMTEALQNFKEAAQDMQTTLTPRK